MAHRVSERVQSKFGENFVDSVLAFSNTQYFIVNIYMKYYIFSAKFLSSNATTR